MRTARTLWRVHDILRCSDASFGKHFEYYIVKYVATHWVQITHKPPLNAMWTRKYSAIPLSNDVMRPLPKYMDYKILNPFIALYRLD